ncbi:alpha-hydroxy acid oxidase [Paraburkholderia nemoris]|uniref:alpha-hydroxy acid oxidase n=1 Tax=Paraburkholderia nemoris TaxID=2793076 RepID=UPI0038BC35E9
MSVPPLNYLEYRDAARRRLPRGLFEYLDRGAESETGIAHNRHVLDSIRVQPRVLVGASPRSQATTLFGVPLEMPVIVAPTAFAGLVWHKGEIALARAAARAGIPFCAATEAITSVEEIADSAGGNIWFQLYLWSEPQHSHALMERAWQAGVRTLVVTVDTPVSPNREYNVRNGFGMPVRLSARNIADVVTHPRWFCEVLLRYYMVDGSPRFVNYPEPYRRSLLERGIKPKIQHEPALAWSHFATLRRHWRGNIVVKGVLRVDDALKAVELGADGIVVSNHGARNLDSAVAPAQILPRIADAVGERIVVLCDSGIQRGSDIVKLIALGAKAVMVGRAFLNATAVRGEAGAFDMASILSTEADLTMAMTGCRTLPDITRDLIL